MTFQRRHAVLFLAIAAWNVVSYANFTSNLLEAYRSGEDRPLGYWVAHTVLIVVNLLIAVVLGRLGYRAWRATSTRPGGGSASRPSPERPRSGV